MSKASQQDLNNNHSGHLDRLSLEYWGRVDGLSPLLVIEELGRELGELIIGMMIIDSILPSEGVSTKYNAQRPPPNPVTNLIRVAMRLAPCAAYRAEDIGLDSLVGTTLELLLDPLLLNLAMHCSSLSSLPSLRENVQVPA